MLYVLLPGSRFFIDQGVFLKTGYPDSIRSPYDQERNAETGPALRIKDQLQRSISELNIRI